MAKTSIKQMAKEQKSLNIQDMIKVKSAATIKAYIKKVAEIQAEEKRLADEKKKLKADILAYMKQNKLDELVVNQSKAIYTQYESQTFDSTLFKAERPKLYEKYLKTQTKERFEVKDAKVSKAAK